MICCTLFFQARSQAPELGAQVWIEPGNTDQQIDKWFRVLAEQDMPLARLFIMWNYIETKPGEWDYTLYDKAFDAAGKYGVRVIATLTANRKPPHRGDQYQLHANELEGTEERLEESKVYIKNVVNHWKDHPALDSWIVTNEAYQYPHEQPLAMKRYRTWLKDKYRSIAKLNMAWLADFKDFNEIEYAKRWTEIGYWNQKILYMDWTEFWRNHLTWWLAWLSAEVKSIDSNALIHIHSENLTGNHAAKSYDFPSWRKHANTLGASCHVSWAFGSYDRDRYALGISYITDVFAGSSKDLPFWITELQGGTNYLSGGQRAMTPTPEDISQWVWTSIGNGAQRVIFWMLNNRLKGFETAEWSMLDFGHNPSERLIAAGKVAKKIKEFNGFFKDAKPLKAPITILLSLESMASENWVPRDDYEGRGAYAHVQSVNGYYEAFSELGLAVNLAYMHDFDWATNRQGQVAIIAHATVITTQQMLGIKQFIANGNTVIMSGLSGFTNEKTEAWVFQDFPFKEFLGAKLKDYRLIQNIFTQNVGKPKISIPAHLWEGEIDNIGANVIGTRDGRVTAIENNYKKGKVIWIPSLLGLGAWLDDNAPLAELIAFYTKDATASLPFKFAGQQKGCLMKILRSGNQYVTIITNGKQESNTCVLEASPDMKPSVIWGGSDKLCNGIVRLDPLETILILWQ